MNPDPDILHWHNSEVLRIETPHHRTDDPVRVLLSAAAVHRAGVAGFLKPLELVFHDATLHGPLGDCMGSVAQGGLRVANTPERELHHMALPWHCQEPLQLTLLFRNGSTLLIEARSAHCSVPPSARFIESYAC